MGLESVLYFTVYLHGGIIDAKLTFSDIPRNPSVVFYTNYVIIDTNAHM